MLNENKKVSEKEVFKSTIGIFIFLVIGVAIFGDAIDYNYHFIAVPMFFVFLISFNMKASKKLRAWCFVWGLLTMSPVLTHYM